MPGAPADGQSAKQPNTIRRCIRRTLNQEITPSAGSGLICCGARIVLNPQRLHSPEWLRVETTRAPALSVDSESGHYPSAWMLASRAVAVFNSGHCRMNSAPKPLIFVVDDEPLLIELAAALLEPAGYTVQTFPDAESALERFARADQRPALVITDYAMHRMTGLDLIRSCRQLNPGQKAILVSGTVDETIYENSRVKPDRFLAKPYQSRQLIALVRSLLAGQAGE